VSSELALAAALVGDGRRQAVADEHATNALDHHDRAGTKLVVQADTNALPGTGVPEAANRDRTSQHLLQAKGLRAELEVSRIAMPPPGLVLNWHDRAVGMHLDGIGSTRETVPLGPERHGSDHNPAPFLSLPPLINPPVSPAASHSVLVLGPYPVNVNQGALASAVLRVLDC